MRIEIRDLAKRFNYQWIFKELDYDFRQAGKTAIIGPNGSGKSTLIKIISGYLSPSRGEVRYFRDSEKAVKREDIHSYLTIVSPELELIEELTLEETIRFHHQFKPLAKGVRVAQVLDIADLKKERNKYIRFFSSGMKQRVKLVLAFLSDVELILFDEPTSNLDLRSVAWYSEMIEKYTSGKTVLISSNQEREYHMCTSVLDITSNSFT